LVTDAQWDVFRLIEQEKKGYQFTSETLGISIVRVKDILAELRTAQPDLFFIDTEKRNISRQLSSKERRKFNADVINYHNIGDFDSVTEKPKQGQSKAEL